MKRYYFELFWNNGNSNEIITFNDFVNSGSDTVWYWKWCAERLTATVAQITDAGAFDRRIELTACVDDVEWMADVLRALADMYQGISFFHDTTFNPESIVLKIEY